METFRLILTIIIAVLAFFILMVELARYGQGMSQLKRDEGDDSEASDELIKLNALAYYIEDNAILRIYSQRSGESIDAYDVITTTYDDLTNDKIHVKMTGIINRSDFIDIM